MVTTQGITLTIVVECEAEGNRLVARGKVLKNGKRIKVCQAEVFCQKNNEEYMCAVALVSVIATKEKLGTVKI